MSVGMGFAEDMDTKEEIQSFPEINNGTVLSDAADDGVKRRRVARIAEVGPSGNEEMVP